MKFILPDDSNLTPSDKAIIQNSILLSVYDETYPLWNIDKATEQVKNWTQRILFWWNSVNDINLWKWWTIALIKDSSKWDSTVEMCRAWSSVNNWGWLQAVSKLFNDFLNSTFNQLFATPRNCLDRINSNWELIPWGKPISAIYSRLKDVQFWWIAPWYIMPWNSLELLDLRIYTKYDVCLHRIKKWDKLYIYSDFNKKIFSKMLENNYWIADFLWDNTTIANPVSSSDFSVRYEKNDALRKYNYSMYEVCDKWCITWDTIDLHMNTIWSWVNLVKLDLFDKNNLELQRKIELLWFKMVSLFPEWNKMMWYWFYSENKNYAIPHYFNEESLKESSSLSIQKEIINSIIY